MRRKLPSEESEFVAHFYSCHCLTSWTLGPAHLGYHLHLLLCGSADFPGLISLLACTLYTLDPSSKAGLLSFLSGWVLLPSQKNTEKEDHILAGCRPSCSASMMPNIRPPRSSFPFLTLLSPCLTNSENTSQRGNQDAVRPGATGFLPMNMLPWTTEFVSPDLCKDETSLVGKKL